MAALSSTRKKWLAAALGLGALTLAAAALRAPASDWLEGRRICQGLTEASKDPDQRLLYFTDARKHPSQSQLEPGTYRLTLATDCYLAQCTFEELDLPDLVPNLTLPATDPCRGNRWFFGTGTGASAVSRRLRCSSRAAWSSASNEMGESYGPARPGKAVPSAGFVWMHTPQNRKFRLATRPSDWLRGLARWPLIDGWVLALLPVALTIVVYVAHEMTRQSCANQLVLRFESPFAWGTYEMHITADQDQMRCTVNWPRGSSATMTCESNALALVYGGTMRSVELSAAPKNVRLLVTKEGVPVIEQHLTPSYTKRGDEGCLAGEVWIPQE